MNATLLGQAINNLISKLPQLHNNFLQEDQNQKK